MRGPLVALGVLTFVVVAGAIAYLLGVGPLAPPTAARSVVFVAISRSADETDAREIEAIDLAAGTRALFDAGGRITALVVSPDRRSLYVGLDGGKVVLLDASTGSPYGSVDLGGPSIVSLVPTADGRTLFAVAVTNVQSAVVPIDLTTKKTADAITLPMTAGAAVLRGDALVVPLGDARALQVAFVDVKTRAVTARLTLPRGSLVAPAAFDIGSGRTGVVAFDGGPGGGATGLRVYLITDALHWSDIALQAPFPQGVARGQIFIGLQAAAGLGGSIHVCIAAGSAARRYVIGPDLKGTNVGSDCGPLAGGDGILLARRDPAQLVVVDEKTGKTTRTLPLAGVPARLAR